MYISTFFFKLLKLPLKLRFNEVLLSVKIATQFATVLPPNPILKDNVL